MRLVFGQDEIVARYVFDNLGLLLSPPYTAIGGTKDGQSLCIGVVFNQYNGSNIEITLYGPKSLSGMDALGAIRGVYHYAFVQLGVNRVSAKTRRSNKRMQRLLPRFGFKFEGISARYFGPDRSEDAIRYVLFPEEARKWING